MPPPPRSVEDRAKVSVGIIGMGDMGRMYALGISRAGWKVNACDRDDKYEELRGVYEEITNVTIHRNGHFVSRVSDYIIYCVEAENIERVVAAYGPSTKLGAIVGGQTSCKAPEIAAFEKYLPEDVEIVSCHSLHGPGVDPRGQPLVLIKHRSSQESFDLVEEILSCFGSKLVYLSAKEHDRITADTQAVTHAAFLSMGTAWHANGQFPWEVTRWSGGIENVKINVTLRIYSNKWHVYAGLAILNPSAKEQISQYATSVTELFKLMLSNQREEFERRVRAAGEFVFPSTAASTPRNGPVGVGGGGISSRSPMHSSQDNELLLRDDILEKYSLSSVPPPLPGTPPLKPNSHLSLLAMVDCWHACSIIPYDHIICSTPLFRLWLGSAEYLFRQPHLLSECISAALDDNTFREDDLEFTFAARGWSDAVGAGDWDGYRRRFERTKRFFEEKGRLEEAGRVGNMMIKTILERTRVLEGEREERQRRRRESWEEEERKAEGKGEGAAQQEVVVGEGRV